jgi:hypothetical protein
MERAMVRGFSRVGKAALTVFTAATLGALIPFVATAVAIGHQFLVSKNPVPTINEFIAIPVLYLTMAVAVMAVLVAFLMRSLRAIVSALVAFVGMIFGFIFSVVLMEEARDYTLEMVSDRSMDLVHAIESYQRSFGRPPAKLADLVPGFLSSIPTTGMRVFSEYGYGPEPGACSDRNAWFLHISMPNFGIENFIYCPMQDYDAMGLDDQYRVIRIGAWVHTSM